MSDLIVYPILENKIRVKSEMKWKDWVQTWNDEWMAGVIFRPKRSIQRQTNRLQIEVVELHFFGQTQQSDVKMLVLVCSLIAMKNYFIDNFKVTKVIHIPSANPHVCQISPS